MLRVYYTDVSALEGGLFDAGYQKVSADRKEKIDRLRFPDDRKRSLGAGLLLQTALGCGEPEIILSERGKPRLAQTPDVFFSLSHSGCYAACAVADRAVGCDLEQLRPVNLRTAKRCFPPADYAALLAEPEEAVRKLLFCRFWTRLESFSKAVDRPLWELPTDRSGWFFREFPLAGYCLTVCSAADECAELIETEIQSLLK